MLSDYIVYIWMLCMGINMTALEICLIVIGIAAIAISYFISEKASEEQLKKKADELIQSEEIKNSLLDQTREKVNEVINTMSEDVTGSVKRELERLSNEKIMAVHDYSDTVLEEINKSHNEIMFLYSMLNEKDKEIKEVIRDAQDILKALKHVEDVKGQEEVVQETAIPFVHNEEKKESQEESIEELEGPLNYSEMDIKTKNDNILKLYKEGKAVVDIAKIMGLGVGEVKLVIDLYKR